MKFGPGLFQLREDPALVQSLSAQGMAPCAPHAVQASNPERPFTSPSFNHA